MVVKNVNTCIAFLQVTHMVLRNQ